MACGLFSGCQKWNYVANLHAIPFYYHMIFWFHFSFHCILYNTHVICIIRTTRQIFGIYFLQFHILLILADGQMEEAEATLSALVDASQYPLSIVMVGVGDGPWGLMEDCDDLLPARKFDNFQVAIFFKPAYALLYKHPQDW